MFKTIVLFLIFLAIWLIFFVSSPFYFDEEKKIEFHVDGPTKIHQLSKILKQEKIIRSERFFRFLLRSSKIEKKIALGYYVFSNQESIFNIVLKLKKGDVEQILVTIVEGYDVYDIAKLLVQKGLVENEEVFIKASSDKKWLNFIQSEFRLNVSSFEGFIYPETYRIPKGAPYALLVRTALQEFKKRVFAKYQYLSPREFYRMLIIASLIQKETFINEEMPLVSSVIHNRIRKGMKLQIDPTIIYAIKKMNLLESSLKDGKVNIQRRHFSLASPYNTYYSKTIPPAPIANPSLLSFSAALAPKKTDYLYFVANPETGRHTFTSNLKDHNLYVERYVKRKREMRLSQ